MTEWQWSVIQALIRLVLSQMVYREDTLAIKNADIDLLREALKRHE